jgi:2,5-dioxopentanoate dehydrogenase
MTQNLDTLVVQAQEAFKIYSKTSAATRARFLRTIATEIENLGADLISTAMAETNLPETRLVGERGRTCGQLRLFATYIEEGSWVEARIDTALPDRQPLPRPHLAKMLQPVGPVAVFAASNFPLAFSTAGGDTASALAAGCPVVMKGHSGHVGTSALVGQAIQKAIDICGLPQGVFAMVEGPGAVVGKALVQNPLIKAVGFTGSYAGGMALVQLASQRPEPIPVFAEMGSINPVVLMPEKLAATTEGLAKQYASSITMGVGQFCTNPGLILAVEGPDLELFIKTLAAEIQQIAPASMLNKGIHASYEANLANALSQDKIRVEGASLVKNELPITGTPTVASVSGEEFLANNTLHHEVFGPYSLVVKCTNMAQIETLINQLEGQLTGTIMATEAELTAAEALVNALTAKVGRVLLNGVPTGVEVSYAMQHGGPFPASTDARFTSVGTDAIKRFVRPICYQNWPDALLPDALKAANPLQIMRLVDGKNEI